MLLPLPSRGAVARLTVSLAVVLSPVAARAQGQARHLNPPELPEARGFTQVVVAPPGRTVYVSGQVAMNRAGEVVGPGNVRAQAEQVYENLRVALAAAGATFDDVVKMTTYLTDASQLAELREVRARYLPAGRPPASTVVQVAALYRPELLIEIEAVAVVAGGAAAPR